MWGKEIFSGMYLYEAPTLFIQTQPSVTSHSANKKHVLQLSCGLSSS